MDVPEQGIYVKFHERDPGPPEGPAQLREVATWGGDEQYTYAWVYDTPTNERRHWWQFWKKRQRLLWSGPVREEDR